MYVTRNWRRKFALCEIDTLKNLFKKKLGKIVFQINKKNISMMTILDLDFAVNLTLLNNYDKSCAPL